MASLQQGNGLPAWSSCKGAQEQLRRLVEEQIVDVPFVPILVMEEDHPLDMGKVLSWAEKKVAKERREREQEESMVALDTRARHVFSLIAVEHESW